jgi:hypothetical protein
VLLHGWLLQGRPGPVRCDALDSVGLGYSAAIDGDLGWWGVARKDPQEKKALSYARDRRNDFRANDKAARKSIRRNKRLPNRADRHRERQVLTEATGYDVVEHVAERAETKLVTKKSMWMTKGWRKWRDAALGETVVFKLRRRARTGMADPDAVEASIARIRHRAR